MLIKEMQENNGPRHFAIIVLICNLRIQVDSTAFCIPYTPLGTKLLHLINTSNILNCEYFFDLGVDEYFCVSQSNVNQCTLLCVGGMCSSVFLYEYLLILLSFNQYYECRVDHQL